MVLLQKVCFWPTVPLSGIVCEAPFLLSTHISHYFHLSSSTSVYQSVLFITLGRLKRYQSDLVLH